MTSLDVTICDPIVTQSRSNQSSKEPLTITGSGFKGEPVLNFEPAIWSEKNYTVTVVSETELKLELVEGSMWSKTAGALMVKGINVGDGDVRRENRDAKTFVCLCTYL